ncbi:MAG: 50S ribosomal protein L2 [Proteobacteria bacterium]|jgi:large subunit ribosomal protein L2|nr:50S ribosomal protein L2 [Pseudomonadota bacterium]
MAIKIYKPTTPGRRGASVVDYSVLDKVAPFSPLLEAKTESSGRNNTGRITVRHQGGGVRQNYRIIDWKRNKLDVAGKVEFLEYDPNRSAFIARILYSDGERRYILCPDGLRKGDTIVAAKTADVKIGNAMTLQSIPVGTFVHNIEMRPGKGGQMARSAGTYAQLMGRVDGYAQLRMPSGEMRRVPEVCCATIGQVGNKDHFNETIGKAGRSRWLGIRPTVRGCTMNPVDHPHGGGEGRSKGGKHPVSPWAQPTKGYKTRKNKRTTVNIIRDRRQK